MAKSAFREIDQDPASSPPYAALREKIPVAKNAIKYKLGNDLRQKAIMHFMHNVHKGIAPNQRFSPIGRVLGNAGSPNKSGRQKANRA